MRVHLVTLFMSHPLVLYGHSPGRFTHSLGASEGEGITGARSNRALRLLIELYHQFSLEIEQGSCLLPGIPNPNAADRPQRG